LAITKPVIVLQTHLGLHITINIVVTELLCYNKELPHV